MKVGILTYHRSQNYGALLQAIALRSVLASMGHCVFYIDYFPEYHRRLYAVFDWRSFVALPTLKKRINYCLKKSRTLIPRLIRKHRFNRFISTFISPFCLPVTDSFDIVVYGSDQIWRKQPYIKRYDPIFFGVNTLKTKRHVSYAASTSGVPTDADDICSFLRLTSHMDVVSVREEITRVFLNNYGVLDVRVDLDPVFLLTATDWYSIVPDRSIINGRYILYYDLQGDVGSPVFNQVEVLAFAKNNQCRLVRTRGVATTIGSIYDRHFDNPESFINLIRHAECVVTSSYHGLVFSLLFNRPVICRFIQNSERAKSLLHSIDADYLFLNEGMKIPKEIRPLCFNFEDKIAFLRCSSLQYLHNLVE